MIGFTPSGSSFYYLFLCRNTSSKNDCDIMGVVVASCLRPKQIMFYDAFHMACFLGKIHYFGLSLPLEATEEPRIEPRNKSEVHWRRFLRRDSRNLNGKLF